MFIDPTLGTVLSVDDRPHQDVLHCSAMVGRRQVVLGKLTLGEFVAFMGYLAMLTWPSAANISTLAASMGRMLDIMELLGDPRRAGSKRSFRASGIPQSHISVSIPKTRCCTTSPDGSFGSTLAIVGHTGSGKSTLVNLIPRLYNPSPGTLFIDGQDVRQWPLSELRKSIGYVPQETFLFSDTIHENIAFGGDSTGVDMNVPWAAGVSQIAEDVEGFSLKMQTHLGERGITLSGGQKQRVAISRAVAILPKILIFDDSLSNVDTYTEERILEELTKVMKNRTTILVSHRISTVKNANQIIVLKDGAIVEHGTHDSLMNLQGVYADLYQKQLLEEELEIT
jgi:ATP-binding cassette subfamily B protein